MKNKVTTRGVDSTVFNNQLFVIFVTNFTAEESVKVTEKIRKGRNSGTYNQ